MEIFNHRQEYQDHELLENSLSRDPFHQFSNWYGEIVKLEKEPNAMALATSDAKGRPSNRMVLLKAWSEKGFLFFTNYESHKGHELQINPFAAGTLFWQKMERQVNFQGPVEKASVQLSDEYFSKRPRKSQLSAWASKQGKILGSREELEKSCDEYTKKFEGQLIPRPPDWGGYWIVPDHIEFWQGRKNRLHDRFVYLKHQADWKISRLNP